MASFLDREDSSHSDPHVPGEGDQCCHLCPLSTGILAKCKDVETSPIKTCDTTLLNKSKDEDKNQI